MRGNKAEEGQSTLEFALVTVAFLAMILAFGVLFRFYESGALVEHAQGCASHCIEDVALPIISDVFLY